MRTDKSIEIRTALIVSCVLQLWALEKIENPWRSVRTKRSPAFGLFRRFEHCGRKESADEVRNAREATENHWFQNDNDFIVNCRVYAHAKRNCSLQNLCVFWRKAGERKEEFHLSLSKVIYRSAFHWPLMRTDRRTWCVSLELGWIFQRPWEPSSWKFAKPQTFRGVNKAGETEKKKPPSPPLIFHNHRKNFSRLWKTRDFHPRSLGIRDSSIPPLR